VKSNANPPVAEDYQTADGVPFPPKTGSKFFVEQGAGQIIVQLLCYA